MVGSGEIRDRLATEDHRLSDNPTVGIRLGDEIDGDGGMRGVEVGDVDVRLSDVELYGALVWGSGGEGERQVRRDELQSTLHCSDSSEQTRGSSLHHARWNENSLP